MTVFAAAEADGQFAYTMYPMIATNTIIRIGKSMVLSTNKVNF